MIVSISLTGLLGGLYATLIWYADAIDRPGFRRYATKFAVGSAHFLAHLVAMFMLSLFIVSLNNQMTPTIERYVQSLSQTRDQRSPIVQESLDTLQRKAQRQKQRDVTKTEAPSPVRQIVGFTSYPILMVIFGALVGGSLWGFYWVLTGLARMHAADAFAALRIKDYKTFLRMKLEPGRLTIYPLGIDKVPGADDWLNAPRDRDNPLPHNPKLIAAKPINVHLIEAPIVIDRRDEKAE
jgi:hypothetical protein